MHSEGKYLLRHDGLSDAQAQVQLCLRVSHPAEYMAIKAGTVGQIRPDTHQGSVHQPVHVKDLHLLIGHSRTVWMVTSFKQYLAAFFQISNRSACRAFSVGRDLVLSGAGVNTSPSPSLMPAKSMSVTTHPAKRLGSRIPFLLPLRTARESKLCRNIYQNI